MVRVNKYVQLSNINTTVKVKKINETEQANKRKASESDIQLIIKKNQRGRDEKDERAIIATVKVRIKGTPMINNIKGQASEDQ